MRITCCVIAALPLFVAVGAQEHTVDVFRYDASPRIDLDPDARGRLAAAMTFGELGVDAYLVVVRVPTGQRFVSARAEVREGFFCIPRRRRAGHTVGRIAQLVGHQLVAATVSPDAAELLTAVSDLLADGQATRLPAPRLKRRFKLQARSVEHHQGYVAALLLVASNPMTRLLVSDVVTRPVSAGPKRRSRSRRTVPLPGSDQPSLAREDVMSILAGREQRTDGRPPPF